MLLNVCCAPCALPIISAEKAELFFYNPNIFPREEYDKRLGEVRKIAALFDLRLQEGDYDHREWLEYLKNNLPEPLDSYPENSQRCQICFEYRLRKTAQTANKHNFSSFGTTLSVNRYKETDFINMLGQEIGKCLRINYFQPDLDKEKAYQLGRELSRKYNVYRQKYCGCEFSLKT